VSSSRLSLRLGDYRRVLLSALALQEGSVALVTITPPGNAELQAFDSIEQWNRTAARRWKRLDQRAKGRMRRAGVPLPRLLARVAQRQKRGLDHLHLPFQCVTPADRHSLKVYVAHLKELHLEYGFGFVDDPFKMRKSKAGSTRNMVFEVALGAGVYLCGYLTESPQLVALLNAPDASFRPLWVTPALTMRSGVTCTRLRRVRFAFHVVRALRQGSRPTMPCWWPDLRERAQILRLLHPSILAAAG